MRWVFLHTSSCPSPKPTLTLTLLRTLTLTLTLGLTVDESMIPWKGNSGGAGLVPHVSFVKRKPEPLGVELKTVCDCTTGATCMPCLDFGGCFSASHSTSARQIVTDRALLRRCYLPSKALPTPIRRVFVESEADSSKANP